MPVFEHKDRLKLIRISKWVEEKGWKIIFNPDGSFIVKKNLEEITFRKND